VRICDPCLLLLCWRGFAIRAPTSSAGADLQSVPPPLTLVRICNPCLLLLCWRGFAIRTSTPYAGADLQSVPPPLTLARICNPCLHPLSWRGFVIRASITYAGADLQSVPEMDCHLRFTMMAIPGEVLQTEKAETRLVVFSSLIF